MRPFLHILIPKNGTEKGHKLKKTTKITKKIGFKSAVLKVQPKQNQFRNIYSIRLKIKGVQSFKKILVIFIFKLCLCLIER